MIDGYFMSVFLQRLDIHAHDRHKKSTDYIKVRQSGYVYCIKY